MLAVFLVVVLAGCKISCGVVSRPSTRMGSQIWMTEITLIEEHQVFIRFRGDFPRSVGSEACIPVGSVPDMREGEQLHVHGIELRGAVEVFSAWTFDYDNDRETRLDVRAAMVPADECR